MRRHKNNIRIIFRRHRRRLHVYRPPDRVTAVPPMARQGEHYPHSCHYRQTNDRAKAIGGSFDIPGGDEDGLLNALVHVGPISVAFDVADDFQHYKSGVYSSAACRSGELDVNHAVLAVGYGVDISTGLAYWTIKNSWGVGFGEEGFFRIHRGVNMCGLADCSSYPLLREPDEQQQRPDESYDEPMVDEREGVGHSPFWAEV
eukprot:GHVS01048866.1.p1 GENE.GHVS01048866.1~~GHVS01048866.1.p1  ORF type:complete len:202 (+),score=35.28 GHVS01048866.1:143-748(+)